MVTTIAMSRRPRLYVSFCGFDAEFAETLIQHLQTDGRFEISFDPDTTINEDDWKTQVGDLIAKADTVLFVVSPDALQTCGWEMDCAHEYAKRIVPVVCRPLDGAKVPDELSGISLVDFSRSPSFLSGFNALLGLLASDIDWLRENTRLLARALKWEKSGRSNHLLLTGDEIKAAKMWTFDRPEHAAKPNDLHMTFISTSEAVQLAQTGAVKVYEAELDEAQAVAQLSAAGNDMGRWKGTAVVGLFCLLVILVALSSGQPSDARMEQLAEQQQSEAAQIGSEVDKTQTGPGKDDSENSGQNSGFGIGDLGDAIMWRVLPMIDRLIHRD